MERIGFKMKLHEGKISEYKKRHDEIWPDLIELLKGVGVNDYSIFLDEETHVLYASLKIEKPELLDSLPKFEVMQKWWKYMGDIMDANPDNSPVVKPLTEVFYLG